MKSILDKSFAYTNSASTDIAATFRRVRKEMKRAQEIEAAKREQDEREAHTVVPLQRKGRSNG